MRQLITILILVLLLPIASLGQVVFPIRTITNIVPPAPYTLDGFTSQPGRLIVNIMVDDVTLNQYPVKIRMHLEGNGIRLTTSSHYQPRPIYLDGGVAMQFTGPDLEDLMNPNNITFQGYSLSEYKRNGRLPEGVYRIRFEVLDYYRGFSVSSAVPGVVLISLANAPFLTFPANKSEINPDFSTQIRFSWMGTFTAIPDANIEYRFRLWHVRPETRDPYEATRVLAPLYEEIVSQTALIFNGGMPALLIGNTYAWQVTAIDQTGQVIFKNNGQSEVFTFRYGKLCDVPDAIISKVGYNTATIKWQANPSAGNYRVSYRDKSNTEWNNVVVQSPGCTIENLRERADYEVQVTALCATEESAPSRLLSFKTNRNVNYACGAAASPVVFNNNEPLGHLKMFDEFKAADFYITVLEAEGTNGVFSGRGVTSFPYLKMVQFQVEFRNITINTDFQMTAGEVVFAYNEKSNLITTIGSGSQTGLLEEIPFSLNNAINQLTNSSVVYNQNVTDITISGNAVVVTLENGEKHTIEIKDGETIGIITPDAGYVVDASTGQVFEIPNKPPGSANSVLPPSQTNIYDCVTSFKPAANHRFGFDEVGDGLTKPNQYFLKDKTGNNIHWKSLEAGSTDYLVLTTSGNCPTDSLRFIRETGIATAVNNQGRSNALNLLVAGGMDGTEEVLTVARATTVMVTDTTSRETLTETGALGLVSYTRLHKTVVLIPVNTATLPTNISGIQQRLNQLYAPAIVEWRVQTDEPVILNRIEEGDFKTTGVGMFSKYTSDMRQVINAYEKQRKAAANTVYLFFINVPDSQLEGFMPLTGEYGFIFNYKSNPDLLAHELAHGTFNLRHTFSDKAQHYFNQGTTKNLLDYSNSTELWKYQWDLIHNPEKILFSWAQDEEEGALKTSIVDFLPIMNYSPYSFSTKELKDIKMFATTEDNCTQLDTEKDWLIFSNKIGSILVKAPKGFSLECILECGEITHRTNITEQFVQLKNNKDLYDKMLEKYPEECADKCNCEIITVELFNEVGKIKSKNNKGESILVSRSIFDNLFLHEISTYGFAPSVSETKLDIKYDILHPHILNNNLKIQVVQQESGKLMFEDDVVITKNNKSGTYSWNGMMNQGEFLNKKITSGHSWFLVRVTYNDEPKEKKRLIIDKDMEEWAGCNCKDIKNNVVGGFDKYKDYKKQYLSDGLSGNIIEYFHKNINKYTFIGHQIWVHDKFWNEVLKPIDEKLDIEISSDLHSFTMRGMNNAGSITLSPHAYGCGIDFQAYSNPQIYYNCDRPIFYLIKMSTGVNFDKGEGAYDVSIHQQASKDRKSVV